MQIKTKTDINARTLDGREVVADDGAVLEIDGDDAGMVGLAKSLISSGQAEFHGDAGAIGSEFDDETDADHASDEFDSEDEAEQSDAEAETEN